MITKQSTLYRWNARKAFLSVAFLVVATLLPQLSRADDTYTIRVTYHRYDGHQGHDSRGGNTYRVKVHHGHHYYYVYLHQPLPQLKGHEHEKVPVVVSSNNSRWLSLSVHGNSARVHKVVKIGHD